jgi:subtilisin family serine protease
MKTLCRRHPFVARSVLALSLALAAMAMSPGAHAKSPKDPFRDAEVLVRLHSTAGLAPLLATYHLALIRQSGARPVYRLQVLDGSSVIDKVKALALDPEVITAEPNSLSRSPEARRNVVWAIGTEAEYTEQWAPAAMRLAEAQAITQGAGVRVAVLDTGVDATHPALAGKLLPGWDFVDGDSNPAEEGSHDNLGYGHGTHVAGLVALTAPAAKILPLRVLDPDGRGDLWMLSDALSYAIDPDGNPATADGAHVINLSLGTLDRTRIIRAVIQLSTCNLPKPNGKPDTDFSDPGYDGDKARCATGAGAVIIAAAGNEGSDSAREYPAAEGEYGLMPAGASAENHRLADFSNSGSWVDVAAPGDKITSTIPGGLYGTWSGTSMAAPLASGVAALVRARSPKLKAVDVTKRLQDSGARLCGNTNIVQIDALSAVRNLKSADLTCP